MRWAVIGAGMLGMSIAERLGDQGEEVVLFEAGGELGGLASAWELGDVTWDRHYHVTLLSDLRTRAAFERIGRASMCRSAVSRYWTYTQLRWLFLGRRAGFLGPGGVSCMQPWCGLAAGPPTGDRARDRRTGRGLACRG